MAGDARGRFNATPISGGPIMTVRKEPPTPPPASAKGRGVPKTPAAKPGAHLESSGLTRRRRPQGSRARSLPRLALDARICTDFSQSIDREWLVTNGLGGFAAGTVSGANSRRYHGLLVAALHPPVGRAVLVANLDIRVHLGDEIADLGTNEYGVGFVNPNGYSRIRSFVLEGGIPTWEYEIADTVIQKRIWMAQESNTTYVQLTLLEASAPVGLELRPLCTHRDYHAHGHGPWPIEVQPLADGFTITGYPGATPYEVRCAAASFEAAPDWYWNFRHRLEAERGLDDHEDLLCPGRLTLRLSPGESATLVCAAGTSAAASPETALGAVAERSHELIRLANSSAAQPEWADQLVLAADQFLVRRGEGCTVIAGYPWFTDWGRDTMIALPGLTLATGRPERAAEILRTFAQHADRGMLPNRFPDGGETPEYNTVDATLWFFQAIGAYLRVTRDEGFAREIYPVLRDIVDWHQKGTRYQIHVDASDGLLYAGEPGVQLTWMDAKVGDWVVTPRIGKAVEINALWVNALAELARIATMAGDTGFAGRCRALAGATAESFARRFWFAEGGYLYDVIDGPEGDMAADGHRYDASLRPNQLFALSLAESLLDESRARSIVDICERELLTPVGLRSLAPSNSRYIGRYEGGPRERDGAYHQGTVWSWLLGPFALAHFRAYGDRARALNVLAPMSGHLLEGCIGTISEIFDGDFPHRPRGCFAQAWSVAELLRARHTLMEHSND
jgi:predicted glycogen debranching enzyme